MNVAFLLGSGASRPAGLPTTDDLTETILSGDGYARHPDGSYFKGQALYAHNGEPDSHVPEISRFLRWLTCHASPYYDRALGRMANYENLYYLVGQIYDEEVGNLDNLLVFDAQRDIRLKLCECAEHIAPMRRSLSISYVTSEILNYMASVVASKLDGQVGPSEYLSFLQDALGVNTSAQLSVFTLNHDLLLERFLSSRNIPLIDGFGTPVNAVRYWNPRLFSSTDKGHVILLKLHGSIRWFRFRSDGQDWWDERIGLPETGDIQHTRGPDGQMQRAVDSRPLMLIGTFNKIPEYTGSVFSDIFAEFRRRLVGVETLVVCGYGFGDKGINGQLIEWLYALRGRRIVLVHPEPDELRAAARGAIRNKWDMWLSEGVLHLHRSRAEQVAWQDIVSEIGAS